MNKAREFEDFILDDYDYNLLEDWDLEYLWEWVELDDFSDLEDDFGGGFGFDPDGATEDVEEIDPPPEPPPNNTRFDPMNELEDDEQSFLRSIGLLDEDNNFQQAEDTALPSVSSDYNQDEEEDEIDPFDVSFDYGPEDEEDGEDHHAQNIDDSENVSAASSLEHLQETEIDTEGDDFLRSIGLMDEDGNHLSGDELTDTPSKNMAQDNYDDDDDDEGDDFLRSIGMFDDDDEDYDDDDNHNHASSSQAGDTHMLGGDRYITTSAGTIDLELDDILSELQKVEFDEFIQILTDNNYVYYKILSQREWSPEEMDFLESIKPLIEDPNALQRAKKENPVPATTKPIQTKLINTRVYEFAKDMFEDLSKKAEILARNQKRQVTYTPKNMRKLWNLDSQERQEKRIGLLFGKEIMKVKKDTLAPKLEVSRNNMSGVIFGKNEARYLELKEIINCEIQVMTQTLDDTAMNFITQDGHRFGVQFTGFLVTKYGSKIYYLYQSQLKNTVMANRFSDDIAGIIAHHFNPPDLKQFLLGFFQSIYMTLDEHGIDI